MTLCSCFRPQRDVPSSSSVGVSNKPIRTPYSIQTIKNILSRPDPKDLPEIPKSTVPFGSTNKQRTKITRKSFVNFQSLYSRISIPLLYESESNVPDTKNSFPPNPTDKKDLFVQNQFISNEAIENYEAFELSNQLYSPFLETNSSSNIAPTLNNISQPSFISRNLTTNTKLRNKKKSRTMSHGIEYENREDLHRLYDSIYPSNANPSDLKPGLSLSNLPKTQNNPDNIKENCIIYNNQDDIQKTQNTNPKYTRVPSLVNNNSSNLDCNKFSDADSFDSKHTNCDVSYLEEDSFNSTDFIIDHSQKSKSKLSVISRHKISTSLLTPESLIRNTIQYPNPTPSESSSTTNHTDSGVLDDIRKPRGDSLESKNTESNSTRQESPSGCTSSTFSTHPNSEMDTPTKKSILANQAPLDNSQNSDSSPSKDKELLNKMIVQFSSLKPIHSYKLSEAKEKSNSISRSSTTRLSRISGRKLSILHGSIRKKSIVEGGNLGSVKRSTSRIGSKTFCSSTFTTAQHRKRRTPEAPPATNTTPRIHPSTPQTPSATPQTLSTTPQLIPSDPYRIPPASQARKALKLKSKLYSNPNNIDLIKPSFTGLNRLNNNDLNIKHMIVDSGKRDAHFAK
ncbi:hypothetical protein AYI68_g3084 [Smittium mucronatum]|uniref:Uncharacterized protein n=1 Tax=Smittium mucronatum TaxID=133383 RepID=A0A1R0H0X8_9FUNG|nr:hypothetical protein AYI68_g3084 [Smittium mucronatum]